jgi:hypothetical protein
MSGNDAVTIIVKNTSKIADFDSKTQTQFYDWSIYIETIPLLLIWL